MKKINMRWLSKSTGIIVITAILFICAVYLNIQGSKKASEVANNNNPSYNESNDTATTVNAGNYFTAFRQNRENSRAKQIEQLDAIIAHSNTDEETLKEAQELKLALISSMELEFTLESMIKAKGFNDCAVTFHKGSVNVVVNAQQLTKEEVARILEIVVRETGEDPINIKVSTATSQK
ncbi:MAG TPA: SpoIIIAH-like family protein [Clostridiales bacterium]|jgi:stage III sporulation protein AH|nr:SpoIIIAH-like family protein [Clostridiales bacterium]